MVRFYRDRRRRESGVPNHDDPEQDHDPAVSRKPCHHERLEPASSALATACTTTALIVARSPSSIETSSVTCDLINPTGCELDRLPARILREIDFAMAGAVNASITSPSIGPWVVGDALDGNEGVELAYYLTDSRAPTSNPPGVRWTPKTGPLGMLN